MALRKGMERYRYTTQQFRRFIGPGVPGAPYDGTGAAVWGNVVYWPRLHTPEIAIVKRQCPKGTTRNCPWVAVTLAEPLSVGRGGTADDAVDDALAKMEAARR